MGDRIAEVIEGVVARCVLALWVVGVAIQFAGVCGLLYELSRR